MKVAANAGVPLNLAKRVGELAAPHVVYLAGEKIGGDCFEFIREKISSAQRYIFIDDDSRPNLEDDIYDFFGGDSRGAVTITIDLAFVAATLVERTTDKPIVSETSAAKRPHEK